ncbi:hypothetical protein M0802_007626 [Mischocyttarus mexicanus]|nr:hypothetical protein M0802_007626 [Mischocyttarus mexicanus]
MIFIKKEGYYLAILHQEVNLESPTSVIAASGAKLLAAQVATPADNITLFWRKHFSREVAEIVMPDCGYE